MGWLDNLTWTCMVCGDERPDDKVSVAKRAIKGLESRFPDTCFNVRYCNDREACIEEAHGPGPWTGRKH